MTTTTRADAANLAELRTRLRRTGIEPAGLAGDPVTQFRRWQREAASLGADSASAAVLATADRDGRPSARFVDIVAVDTGFVFFTDDRSRKGAELAANPRAALCFGWLELGRQVRVEGGVGRLTDLESDASYGSMPRPMQLLVWASEQGRPAADRAALEEARARAEDRFAGQEIPRPRHWGGWRLVPEEVELWQERADFLQDRFRYRRAGPDGPWHVERLSP